jgi:glucose-6-phosphate 1-dehydrogenase
VLPENFVLIGVARAEGTAESWRDQLCGALKSFVGNAATEFDVDHIDETVWKRLSDKIVYVQGDLTKPDLYDKLRSALGEAEKAHGTQGNAIFYLAVADRLFGSVVEQLGKTKLTDQDRGQYGAGAVLATKARAYRLEPDVAPDSSIETYVAMQVEIDNWRWAGVPFYLRTGKHMLRRNTEIAICFKQAPYAAFQDTPVDTLPPNWLVLRVSPDEGISLQFEVKRRGPVVDLAAVKMDFHYDDWFPKEPNVGYETLLYDVMIGDQTLFMRADMVEQTWRIVQPVLDAWAKGNTADLPIYPSGSPGPAEVDALLARDGRRWRPVHGDDDGRSS